MLGTFAVISVMIAGVVEKSGCKSDNGVPVNKYSGTTQMPLLTDILGTENSIPNFTNIVLDLDNMTLGHHVSDNTACNLAFATAATMLIGIYQVNFVLLYIFLINLSILICLYMYYFYNN